MLKIGDTIETIGNYAVCRHGARNWAVAKDAEIICVTLYKKGAREVAGRLATLEYMRDLLAEKLSHFQPI